MVAALVWYLVAKLNSDVGILFVYVGRGIVYEDVSLLPGQSLIPFVQPMFKDNCSHPPITVVVVVDFKLAQATPFLFRAWVLQPCQSVGVALCDSHVHA